RSGARREPEQPGRDPTPPCWSWRRQSRCSRSGWSLSCVESLPGRPGRRPWSRRAEMAGPPFSQVAGRGRAVGLFVYDFVIGDDWWVAAGVAIALVVTYLLAHAATVTAWWLVPVAVAALMPVSLWRAVRKR